LLLHEGDVAGHILLQGRRIVFEVNRDQPLVPQTLKLLQLLGALGF